MESESRDHRYLRADCTCSGVLLLIFFFQLKILADPKDPLF